jgi:hypothetical protein
LPPVLIYFSIPSVRPDVPEMSAPITNVSAVKPYAFVAVVHVKLEIIICFIESFLPCLSIYLLTLFNKKGSDRIFTLMFASK